MVLLAVLILVSVISSPALAQTAPTISINDVTQSEGASGNTPFVFQVTLSQAASQPVTVSYSTADGGAPNGATAGSDYAATGGVVTFVAGDTSENITVNVNGDTLDEPDEHFFVNLSSPSSNATISDGQGRGTITNDDQGQAPSLTVNDVKATEGDSGSKDFTFTVTLTGATGNTVTVDYTTRNGTATTEDNDYLTRSGTLTFPPSTTTPRTQTVNVPVNGDVVDEQPADQTFSLILGPAANARLGDAEGVGTILNDDARVTVSDVRQLEADGPGTTNMVFTVALSQAPSQALHETQPVSVSYALSPVSPTTAGSSCSTGIDYDTDSTPASPLTFTANERVKTVTVPVCGDAIDEPDDAFLLTATGATSAKTTGTGADNEGVGTILNNDATITIDDVSQNEGNGETTSFVFRVTLSRAPSTQEVTVAYTTNTTNPGTATAGSSCSVAGTDYETRTGELKWGPGHTAPGETERTITVPVCGDTAGEPAQTFFVGLSNPVNAKISDNQGQGTIQNEDGPTALITITDVTGAEGTTESGTPFNFTASLQRPGPGGAVTVSWATAEITADEGSVCAPGFDYRTGNGTVTFPEKTTPGAETQTQTITVNVCPDAFGEPNEAFVVNLFNVQGDSAIDDNQGVGTITNDDEAATPNLAVSDATPATEGLTGPKNFAFTVTLTGTAQQPVTFDYSTSDGSATAVDTPQATDDNDYETLTGSYTLPDADATPQSHVINVQVNGDSVDEQEDNFFLNLLNVRNATVTQNRGEGRILNDDARVEIFDPLPQTEGATGTKNFEFKVRLSRAPTHAANTVSVNHVTANATATGGASCATANADFVNTGGTAPPTAGMLSFGVGESEKTISVPVCGETVQEANETFLVNLSNPSNAMILDGSGTGTIVNDDAAISIGNQALAEGNGGSLTAFPFTLTLGMPSAEPISVTYSTAPGGTSPGTGASVCGAGVDYQSTTGSVTFAPGDTSETVTVSVCGDASEEPDEKFHVNLSNPTVGGTILDGQGEGTILNDDATIRIDDLSLNEGNSGTKTFAFTVSLQNPAPAPVSVNFATANGGTTPATSGASCGGAVDYQTSSGSVSFASGETTKTATVLVCGNSVSEPNETFLVNLSGPSANATILDPQALGTIVNDDGLLGYVLDGYGGVHSVGDAQPLSSNAYWPGWDIANDLALLPSGLGGYVLDGYGGVHNFGAAPPVVPGAYWGGWDIARDIVVNPNGPGGYVLDGYGGIHAFGDAPALASSVYWGGWDIARDLVLLPSGTGGYVLDGYGGVHNFGDAPAANSTAYWGGWDIAREIALLPDGTGGYVLDGYGGLHAFGGAASAQAPYWGGWDIARDVVILADGAGYTLDGYGGVHAFGGAPPLVTSAYWGGWDIARGLVLKP